MIHVGPHQRRCLLTLALIGLSQMAAAQTVTVRSGEHDGFSRLVLTIPEGTNWQTAPTSGGYRLELGEAASGFDLTEAFVRISRDRITALGQGTPGGTLDIEIACECHLEGFLYRPDMLVLDVIDGPAESSVATTAPMVPDPAVLPAAPPVTLAELGPQSILPLFTGIPPSQAATRSPTTLEVPSPRRAEYGATERAILESFARAASQGVFEFPATYAPEPSESGAPLGSGLTPVSDPMDGVPLPLADGTEGRPGIILRTGISRDETGDIAAEETVPACAHLGRLDTAAWIDGRHFFDQIGEGRYALTTETGRVLPQAMVDLARRYVAYGFGAEAADVLGLAPASTDAALADEILTLQTLAAIVDGASAPSTAVAQAIGCGPGAAFWATLARGTLEGTEDAHRNATLVGFRDLPKSLRGHLGLRLAAIFSDAGELLIADQIMAAARGEVTGNGVDADLAQAELDGASRGPEAEIARLDAIAQRSPRLEPETLTRLIDLTSDAGRASDPAVIDLAHSLRFEAEGTEAEAELARAEARALIVGGDFSGALSLIDETADTLGDGVYDALFTETHAALTAHASDTAFLDIVLGTPPTDLPAQVQNDVAARLLSLGFPDLAQLFLASGAEQGVMRERRYLRAAAAAALGDVAGADLALEGMTDPRAQELRAVARDTVGDFTGAYEARDRIPGPTDRLSGTGPAIDADSTTDITAPTGDGPAWRAGDWAGLERSDDTLLSSASRAILSAPVSPGTETPLADRQSLLGRAEETRALTEALLERFPIDPLADG